MDSRWRIVRDLLEEHEADALIVTKLTHIRWLCGFTGSRGLLIVTGEDSHFITDLRYKTQAAQEVLGVKLHISPGSFQQIVQERGFLSGVHTALVQPRIHKSGRL